MIIAAAIKYTTPNSEFIIMGKRHGECSLTAYACGLRKPYNEVQGFVNDKFKFLDRYQAWKEAEANNQILPYPPDDTPSPGMLFSEDLW